MSSFEQLPKIQDADLKGKLVLVRMDHNVVKKRKRQAKSKFLSMKMYIQL